MREERLCIALDFGARGEILAAARRFGGKAGWLKVGLEAFVAEGPSIVAGVAETGARVFLKAETLQRTGSFKFRGAYNKLAQIPQARRAGGVVSYSSGNHAQGVAAAARLLGMPAVIVMPQDAPAGVDRAADGGGRGGCGHDADSG